MKLILVRHGEAGSAASDAERELTDQGRADVRKMTGLVRATGWNVREIRCSPLRRTVSTAGLISEELFGSSGPTPVPDDRLAPGNPRDALGTLLLDHQAHSEAVVWVFHAPDVQLVASELTGLAPSNMYVSPGTMLALNLPLPRPQARSVLVWALQPDFAPNF